MANRNQCPDSKQTGPGQRVGGLTPRETSSSPLGAGNGQSGTPVSGQDKGNRNKRS